MLICILGHNPIYLLLCLPGLFFHNSSYFLLIRLQYLFSRHFRLRKFLFFLYVVFETHRFNFATDFHIVLGFFLFVYDFVTFLAFIILSVAHYIMNSEFACFNIFTAHLALFCFHGFIHFHFFCWSGDHYLFFFN